MTRTAPACSGCAHYTKLPHLPPHTRPLKPLCSHPSFERPDYDVIEGRLIMRRGTSCADARAGICGPDGVLFERRPGVVLSAVRSLLEIFE